MGNIPPNYCVCNKFKINSISMAPYFVFVYCDVMTLPEMNAITNLMDNAVKYRKTDEPLNVYIRTWNDEEHLFLSIRDTGLGIKKENQKKIFEKFYRSEDYRTRETGGTGLGLYISAKLAKKLGTEIQLKSRLNHGSTFAFEIPFAKK